MWYKQSYLPNLLTLIRLVGSPLVMPFFLVYLLPYNNPLLNLVMGIFFLLISLTDFFDGYLARRYQHSSVLGAMLDPIADKFLLYSALISLITAGKLYFFWAIIWIGREFLIMALRQLALEKRFIIAVSSFGKIKTLFQIAALFVIIVNPYQHLGLFACWWSRVELILLIIATGLCLLSAYWYASFFVQRCATLREDERLLNDRHGHYNDRLLNERIYK